MSELSDVQQILKWQKSMKTFVKEALQVEKISAQQEDACAKLTALVWAKIRVHKKAPNISKQERALAQKLGVSIMSGQGTGKDTFAAWAILWFLVCWPIPKVPCTASSGKQLKSVLWSEIAKWRNQSRIQDLVTWENERCYLTELAGQQAFAIARTYNVRNGAEEQAETLAGYHEDFMLYVVDEASGVPDPVYRPIEGSMTGMCNMALIIFNPTRSSGYAMETHRKFRNDYMCLHWSSEDSELVPKKTIERDLKRHGRESNWYRIRRLGLPPVAEKGVLIPWEWIQAAVDRGNDNMLEPTADDPVIMALDVGAGGDDSAMSRSRGPVVYPFEIVSTADSNVLTGWALRLIFTHEPRFVFVDIIGYGWAVAGNLRARYANGEVVDVNVNTEARDKTRFHRLRDELWWSVREEFEAGIISLPDDAILIEELSAFHYEEDHNGLIKVESKDDLATRGFDSPNRADTLMMRLFFDVSDVRKMKLSARDRRREDPDINWRTV